MSRMKPFVPEEYMQDQIERLGDAVVDSAQNPNSRMGIGLMELTDMRTGKKKTMIMISQKAKDGGGMFLNPVAVMLGKGEAENFVSEDIPNLEYGNFTGQESTVEAVKKTREVN
jgi:hypothetical protein